MRIKNSIKSVVSDKGTSQRQVAFGADLDPSVVSDIATGKREPLVGTALKIAAALGCSVDDLFKLDEDSA